MTIRVLTASAMESEVHLTNREVQDDIEAVGAMIMDLYDETPTLDILMVIPEETEQDRWQLCFSGSTLSLDFYPERIEVTDFNDGDEEVIETFPRTAVKQATTWLVNHLRD